VSLLKTAAVVVGGIIALGVVSNGGPVLREDGTVDASATLDQGAKAGGDVAGQVVGEAGDAVGNSIGRSVGSAVDSSDLAKVAAAGAAAAGVVKYGPKITRPTIKLKPIDEPSLTPTTKPAKPKPETTQPTTSNPMSSGGFTVPSLAPLPTWKPCLATPGVLVDC
jgi:hypothetical protein